VTTRKGTEEIGVGSIFRSRRAPRNIDPTPISGYAELNCLTNFTFLRGASRPEELVGRAHALGYAALAITDECSVAGVVRAHTAAKAAGLSLIVGSEFRLACGLGFVALAKDRHGYGQLCRLITRGRRAAEKGAYSIERADVATLLDGCFVLWRPGSKPAAEEGAFLRERFGTDAWLAVELVRDGLDRPRLAALTALGTRLGLRCVATGGVLMHVRERRRLQDALTAIRLGVPLAEAGPALTPNGERHLREIPRLAKLYPPALLEATLEVAAACHFSLDELRYEYPREIVPPGETPSSHLRALVEAGLARRFPGGAPEKVRILVAHELALIADLAYEPFFLTVHDIVAFARSHGILCQGRGSAANSAVCFALGVTEVDPGRMSMLVERFISRERNEPPDIDVDFEHERREEVIQYLYSKYGRDRAALAATVITYRPRSALRDLGKALGLDPVQTERLAGVMQWWDDEIAEDRIRDAGFDPDNPVIQRLLDLARELLGFPRHLSQHVGGFVISEGALETLVPIENAAMPERTVIQWDKDDLDDLGLLKVDVLGLGMLTAIRRALDLVGIRHGRPFGIADIPAEDPVVYDMICRADTIGVFQIESRAQMAMLPRLRPRNYYDIVIQVAIVRPGPIQGDMVHPYLRRRTGEEAVSYPSEAVRGVLERTLGVPLFQEQVMQLAIVAAGFSPGEADQLRRAMAAWKRRGGLGHFERRLLDGMRARGYAPEFAKRVFQQILGFGEYGFPEAHAASFALLVYVSAWLKCHEPAAFTCALLNSQPMGFYAPSQLVRDVRAHGVEVRPVCVTTSAWPSTLEGEPPALRLGMHLVKGLSADAATRVVAVREGRAFSSVEDVAARAMLDRDDLEALADAGALARLSGHRYRAFWDVAGRERSLPTVPVPERGEAVPLLPHPTEGQDIVADYRSTGLTLGRHPLALLRHRLSRERIVDALALERLAHGTRVRAAGLVVTRQRPASASGVTFVTLEDETGHVNLVVWERVGYTQRRALLESRLLEVHGELQREGQVMHIIAERLIDRSVLLGALTARSRDFR
jgi:error-prone DNA polymerase